jgi:hypothetical protein
MYLSARLMMLLSYTLYLSLESPLLYCNYVSSVNINNYLKTLFSYTIRLFLRNYSTYRFMSLYFLALRAEHKTLSVVIYSLVNTG